MNVIQADLLASKSVFQTFTASAETSQRFDWVLKLNGRLLGSNKLGSPEIDRVVYVI